MTTAKSKPTTPTTKNANERNVLVPYLVAPAGEDVRDEDGALLLDEDGYPVETETEPYTVHVRVRMKAGRYLIGALPSIAGAMSRLRSVDITDGALDPQVIGLIGALLEVVVTDKDDRLWSALLEGKFRGHTPGRGPIAPIPGSATCAVDFEAFLPILMQTLAGAGVSLGGQ